MASGRLLAGLICALAGLSGRASLALALTALLAALAVGGLSRRWGLPAGWQAAWLADAWTLGLVMPLATMNAYVATQDRALTAVEASLYFETALGLCAAVLGLLVLSRRLASAEPALRSYLLLPSALQVAILMPGARQGDPRSLLVALAGIYLMAGVITAVGWALPRPSRPWLALAGLIIYLALVGALSGGLAALFARPAPVPLVHTALSLAGVVMLAVEGQEGRASGHQIALARSTRRRGRRGRNRRGSGTSVSD